MSVINWVKHLASTIQHIPKKNETVNRKTKRLVGFYVGDRSSKSFENLCENISHVDARSYATVERMNRLLRHYLAHFARKTYCWSKNFNINYNLHFKHMA